MGPRVGALVWGTDREKEEARIMGINTPKRNRPDESAADQRLIDGFNKNGAALPAIAIAGTTTTTKDIIATLQGRIDSAREVLSTRATWQAAVQADRLEHDRTKAYVSGLRQTLLVALAGKIDTLADFGLTPRKVHAATPEENLARTQKILATRAARHTMGSRQKAAIKGTVSPGPTASAPPVVTAPVVSTPAPLQLPLPMQRA
jgi:hypothetical protein